MYLQYEYEVDAKNERIVLGRGSYGTVYAALNQDTQVSIAIKQLFVEKEE